MLQEHLVQLRPLAYALLAHRVRKVSKEVRLVFLARLERLQMARIVCFVPAVQEGGSVKVWPPHFVTFVTEDRTRQLQETQNAQNVEWEHIKLRQVPLHANGVPVDLFNRLSNRKNAFPAMPGKNHLMRIKRAKNVNVGSLPRLSLPRPVAIARKVGLKKIVARITV